MRIKRCSEQSDDSLEDFYQKISENKVYDRAGVGKAMLQLLNAFNELFEQIQVWGVTSHARLILFNTDDVSSGGYITVSSYGFIFYTVEYLLPVAKRPWQNAQVTGTVDTIEQALDYVLIAMRECEGWVGNAELMKLLEARSL